MTEAQLQGKMIKCAESAGYYVIKLMHTNKNGIPDLMLIKKGRALFIEVKREGQKARPLQEFRIKELHSYGCRAYCFDSLEEMEAIL